MNIYAKLNICTSNSPTSPNPQNVSSNFKKDTIVKHKLYQIDAFTDTIFGGNPACVVPLENWLSDELLLKIAKELNNGKVKISNLESVLKNALNKLEKLTEIWGSGELEEKRALQKTLFPEGIFYDVKNNQYLTRNKNQFIELVNCLSTSCEDIKKEDLCIFSEKSSLVSGSRLELPTFGL